MIVVTATGKVNAVKATNKALMLSLSSKKYGKETVIGVTIFLNSKSKLQNSIRKGAVIMVSGDLDVNEYNGKTYVRILASPSSVQIISFGSDNRKSERGQNRYNKQENGSDNRQDIYETDDDLNDDDFDMGTSGDILI